MIKPTPTRSDPSVLVNLTRSVSAAKRGQFNRPANCTKLQCINGLMNSQELEEIYLSGCRSLESFQALHNLPKIKKIIARQLSKQGTQKIKEVTFMGKLVT